MARTVKSDKKTALGTRLDLVVALFSALAETAGIPGITYRWRYYGEGPGPEGALGSVRALSLLDQAATRAPGEAAAQLAERLEARAQGAPERQKAPRQKGA